MNPTYRSLRPLAVLSVLLPVFLLFLSGLGFVWSLFFDLPGHDLVALVSIPSLVTAAIFTGFVWSASRDDRVSRRLSMIGLACQMAVGLLFAVLLVSRASRAAVPGRSSAQAAGGNGGQAGSFASRWNPDTAGTPLQRSPR